MYQVKRYGRVVKSMKGYASYEQARLALRKYIRSLVNQGKAVREDFGTGAVQWDKISRNPVNFTVMGFNIVRG